MKANLYYSIKNLLADEEKLYQILWDMTAEAYTTKTNYLQEYRLMAWDDGTFTTNLMEPWQSFIAEENGTAYCIASVKEWNSEQHEWYPGETTQDIGLAIMKEYNWKVNWDIEFEIEQAIREFEDVELEEED